MNKGKIMKLFFESPNTEMHLREIARKTSLSPNTVMYLTDALIKEKLLLKERKKPIVNFKANIDSPRFVNEKRLFNLKKVYDSGLMEYLINEYNHPEAIILFGSYSKGEDNEKGDMDLAVITKRKEKLNLDPYEKKLRKTIHLLEVDTGKVTQEFVNSLANGIVMYGYLSIK